MPTLFRHPRIYTGDPASSYVTGLLVENDRISTVGADADLAAAHPTAEVVDLPGELVMPGMHDAHIHTAGVARALAAVDLRAVRSLEEALATVRDHVSGMPSGAWVFGGRWDSNKWAVPVQPTAHDLDSVSGDHPVALSSIDGHTLWANTAALRAAGIDASWTDPPGGMAVRDAAGNPTGILRETAQDAIEELEAESSDLRAPLLAAQEHLLSVGLTAVTDLNGEDARAAYLSIKAAGELKIRVVKGIPMDALQRAIAEGRRTGDGDDWFRVGPLKLFSDGALGSRTAHLSRPYADKPDNLGMAVMTHTELYDAARSAVDAGIAVATHAIGDRANHVVLDVYEKLRRDTGTTLALSIEHTQFLQPGDVARLRALGVTASMQPTHCTSDIALVEALLSEHDLVGYGWRSVLDSGAALAFGSDAPVEEANPFHGIHAAITRQRGDGTPAGGFQPAERISVKEAIAAYATGPAVLTGTADARGTLTAGKLADFIAVDTDITSPAVFADEPLRIREAQVLQSVVGGETRWQRS
ncbi:amidohydrolase [Flexivirga caeni]|uniref:Amidohydrolase n=1 Tax=Flexivirga caeni TaxID=2294115 RepID=A0A3M9M1A8_9MICO|nr:amidohydrolase [Flexivirga caeni]RNI19027.1 amidohydrolase [Flexivirga caeni]